MLHPSDELLKNCSNGHVHLTLGALKLDTVLQVGSQESRAAEKPPKSLSTRPLSGHREHRDWISWPSQWLSNNTAEGKTHGQHLGRLYLTQSL